MGRMAAMIVVGLVVLAFQAAGAEPVKAVVVTGGHGFDKKAFLGLFEGLEGIEVVHAPQRDHSEIFEDIGDWPYDVIVFYHMTQRISERRRENFLKLLDRGVGVVALHHCLAAFQDWPEYAKIIGGKYYLKKTAEHEKSGYKHGVDFTVQVADPEHLVTKGLEDFEVHDETYIRYSVDPEAHVLLTTEEPTSEKVLAWAKTYGKARVCTIEMGHGTSIFRHPAYRRLIAQAIRWAAPDSEGK